MKHLVAYKANKGGSDPPIDYRVRISDCEVLKVGAWVHRLREKHNKDEEGTDQSEGIDKGFAISTKTKAKKHGLFNNIVNYE